jgi:cellulose synthase/poly-beta-1,6-N-acetylglucosamine synthase-like glycosyltransferase/peptidoglycan/xylan/chitin deacetylase (PgdA/CDA1 family)
MPTTSEVFFDPTGRRWRRVKRWMISVPVLAGSLFAISWGPVHAPPTLAGHGRPPPRPPISDVADAPIVGTGPLVRLVRINHQPGKAIAVDPLTGDDVATLTAAERQDVGKSQYAMYRYGYDEGVHRTIALTFDDGPDPAWTPKILDTLGHHKVPATFFVVGSETVRNPDLVNRTVREGHTVANHTMSHPELTVSTAQQEIVTADRILTATTGVRTSLFRLPYLGHGPSGYATEDERLLLEAQRLGYLVSVEDFDTNDWKYGDPATRPGEAIPLPPSTMDNITILLHDGGGNREETLAYLNRLIPWAKAQGYSFHSLPQVSGEVAARTSAQAPNLWDRETLWWYQARWLVPDALLRQLFWIAVISVVLGGIINVMLAVGRAIRNRRGLAWVPLSERAPPVTAVVAALNEAAVIERCLTALGRSRYRGLSEIIVVDDGSTDDTADIVDAMAARDPRIRLIRQPNRGKPSALNRAFVEAQGEVVVTLDADTLLTPTTIDHLMLRYIRDKSGRLGAVAGTVKVGNLHNLLTRWQALEYIIQIGIDRSAQDALCAIMVVPGACAAWRRDAVLRAGGYSSATLAEDCDLALTLQRLGYHVAQADRAQSFTEAPESFRELSRQRFRWTFGNVQALWKHRRMIFNPRYGWLGMFTLPAAAVSILMPLVFLPFVYIMAAVTISESDGMLLLGYAAVFVVIQSTQAVAGVVLTRERPVHLLIVPLYRLVAEPLRAYLLYKSAITVLRGTRLRWHKVPRTGSVVVREPAGVEVRP